MTATAQHPTIELNKNSIPWHGRLGKRVIDVALGLIVLVLLVVPLAVVNWLYYLPRGGGAPIVSQPRGGKGGRPFAFYQLRVNARSGELTRLGYRLRSKGIDEIPQVINILLGQMSLVGPRANIIASETQWISLDPQYRLRYAVRPGLLGLGIGMVTNRQLLAAPSEVSGGLLRLPHDLRYINEWSWRLEWLAIRVSVADIIRGHDPRPRTS